MSAAVVERDLVLESALLRSLQPQRTLPAPVRPGRRSGRSTAPKSRPAAPIEAPVLQRPRSTAQSCAVDQAPATPTTGAAAWRLTDRGIAVVLVVGAMIAFTALTVVGLTAFRVTSEHYQSSGIVHAES